ncbi:molecular chaperone [Serratia microhaemolytica]|uniref:fimbrial biogenesis chaperone n=1 Tax=Serratia microhaemolytica TaxID=2675110 RepID=UPI000FDEC6A4|nr:molecular chaperone [Serratia microhaemolytica]
MKQKIRIALSLFIIGTSSALAGISIDSTRIIFHASNEARGQGIGVTSAQTSPQPYLVKAQITRDVPGNDNKTPFVTTPSLFRLEPGSTNQVLIMKKPSDLPKDRESLYYFRAIAMPAGSRQDPTQIPAVGGTLKVATAAIVKLFYRPSGLPVAQRQAMGMLQFSNTSQGLRVSNPSPYYITLSSLRIGGVTVPLNIAKGEAMIAPFAQQIYAKAPRQGRVEWKAINDFGAVEVFNGSVR